jgi:hypothetical protein
MFRKVHMAIIDDVAAGSDSRHRIFLVL